MFGFDWSVLLLGILNQKLFVQIIRSFFESIHIRQPSFEDFQFVQFVC